VTDDRDELAERDELLPRDALEEWTVPEMPKDMKERVMAQIHEQWNMGVPPQAYGAPPARSTAGIVAILTAAAALAASAAAIFLTLRGDDRAAPVAVAEPTAAPQVVVAADPPRAPRGHLTIEVTPPDAIVELDGNALPGPSPFVATWLSLGAHEIRVRREGYTEWTRVVQIPEGQLHLPIALVGTGAPPSGLDASAFIPTPPPTPEPTPTPTAPEAKLPESHGAADPLSSGTPSPRVRQAKAQVKGALDSDIIRRIVRAHINEVRYCYNQGLVKDATLKGRIAIQFTISPTGNVAAAVVQESSLKDNAVGQCIAKAVKRWKFPKPQGEGNVVVTYPFVLEPG
jgi:TonB family protein